MVVNTAAELLKVRRMLGGAAELKILLIEDDLITSSSTVTLRVTYTQVYDVSGVWLATDPTHAATNYYGAGSSFNAYTGEMTLDAALPGLNTSVLVTYSYYKGLPDEVVDDQVTDGKEYVKWYTNRTFDWTASTSEVNIAKSAMSYRAAQGCLISLFSPDVLQMGFNFQIEEFRIESKTWAGSMGIRDLLDLWQSHIDALLAILGKYQYFVAPTSYQETEGRGYHGYRMDRDAKVS